MCSPSVSPVEVLSALLTITSPASLSLGSPRQYRTWIEDSGLPLWDGWRVETIHLKQQKMREIKYLNGTKWCQWISMFTSYKADARIGRSHPLQWVGSASFDAAWQSLVWLGSVGAGWGVWRAQWWESGSHMNKSLKFCFICKFHWNALCFHPQD